jgi:replicative DNA helicase
MAALERLSEYGKAFQLKVLGSLLTDKKFILNVRDTLRVEYFDVDSHRWIVETILSYFDKYHTNITLEVLKVELKKVENEVLKVALKEELRNSYDASKDDLDYVQEEFSTFCKNQELKAALLESADLMKTGEFEVIRSRIEHALRAGLDKNLGHEYNKNIESRYRVDYRPTIPTPWPSINKMIQGGWGPGDLSIVFGNPGGGKSWMMVAVAAHAVKLGFNVNYYTLELGEDYVGKRFCLLLYRS